ETGAFERQLYRINMGHAQVDQLNRALIAVPVRKPLSGEIDVTSEFGVRMDPFFRALAMHTGIDLRSSIGEPVRATAAGKVVTAGWSGGLGKVGRGHHGKRPPPPHGPLAAVDRSQGPGRPRGPSGRKVRL